MEAICYRIMVKIYRFYRKPESFSAFQKSSRKAREDFTQKPQGKSALAVFALLQGVYTMSPFTDVLWHSLRKIWL